MELMYLLLYSDMRIPCTHLLGGRVCAHGERAFRIQSFIGRLILESSVGDLIGNI